MAAVWAVCIALAAALGALVVTEAFLHHPEDYTRANKFIVTYSVVPGDGLYHMPRTIAEAEEDKFTFAKSRNEIDGTTVWCRDRDYRVCCLFDEQGSIAGIQVSASRPEVRQSRVPLSRDLEPQWFRQSLLNARVYSTIAYFIDIDTLLNGGRSMDTDTLTAPNGIYLLETRNGQLSTVHIPAEEQYAGEVDYTKQNCLRTKGQHYFYNMTSSSQCEDLRPYFLLYGVRTKSMLGFGVQQFGNISSGTRNWYENQARLSFRMTAPRAPSCLANWIQKYTLNNVHVFFVDRPWMICCHPRVISYL